MVGAIMLLRCLEKIVGALVGTYLLLNWRHAAMTYTKSLNARWPCEWPVFVVSRPFGLI
jgi:hypothetical protein